MKPFLKWVGGKTQILSEVISRVPQTIDTYHEPFLGGGSVLLALLSERNEGKRTMGEVRASDVNPALIQLYKNVQQNVETLIEQLNQLVDAFTALKGIDVNRLPKSLEDATSPESFYYWVRSEYNKRKGDDVRASAMFLFLNKTCFRGVYREGPNGFNVPFGHYKNPSVFDADHLRAVSVLIGGVVFSCQPFTEALDVIESDFVYLDPPYVPLKATSFVGYTADGFGIENHRELFARCAVLPCHFLLSNSNIPLVTDAFPPPFITSRVSCRRAIHSKNPNARVDEVLITN